MLVFVKNKHGKSLMPCRPRKARMLLKEKKAKIISYQPFTIQLLYGSSGYTQETQVGVDLGAKHVGIAVTSDNHVLMKGEIELRQDVKSLLETRKTYRRSRRNRKTRYRKARFLNRKKETGWLPPSIQSRINNTFFWIDTFLSVLPKSTLHIEVGKFDIQKMMNPNIKGKEYQQGETFGYHDVRYYVLARDCYTCQVCKKKNKILNTHHIVYRSHGGTDQASNLITVCTDCHTFDNHQEGQILWKWMMEKKKTPSYKEGPFMNSFRQRVFTRYPHAYITYGSITTPKRKELGLEKTHYNDAIAITGIDYIRTTCKHVFRIKQFRKKKRSLHEATARKGRKTKNTTAKRNKKNTTQVQGIYLGDKVKVFGQVGFVTGFTGKMVYVQDIDGQYIQNSSKLYKQVKISDVKRIHHTNNWQFLQCS
ncbi:RNA-guided endonuclease IscB [Microbacteriaceae bacterium 4G12]